MSKDTPPHVVHFRGGGPDANRDRARRPLATCDTFDDAASPSVLASTSGSRSDASATSVDVQSTVGRIRSNGSPRHGLRRVPSTGSLPRDLRDLSEAQATHLLSDSSTLSQVPRTLSTGRPARSSQAEPFVSQQDIGQPRRARLPQHPRTGVGPRGPPSRQSSSESQGRNRNPSPQHLLPSLDERSPTRRVGRLGLLVQAGRQSVVHAAPLPHGGHSDGVAQAGLDSSPQVRRERRGSGSQTGSPRPGLIHPREELFDTTRPAGFAWQARSKAHRLHGISIISSPEDVDDALFADEALLSEVHHHSIPAAAPAPAMLQRERRHRTGAPSPQPTATTSTRIGVSSLTHISSLSEHSHSDIGLLRSRAGSSDTMPSGTVEGTQSSDTSKWGDIVSGPTESAGSQPSVPGPDTSGMRWRKRRKSASNVAANAASVPSAAGMHESQTAMVYASGSDFTASVDGDVSAAGTASSSQSASDDVPVQPPTAGAARRRMLDNPYMRGGFEYTSPVSIDYDVDSTVLKKQNRPVDAAQVPRRRVGADESNVVGRPHPQIQAVASAHEHRTSDNTDRGHGVAALTSMAYVRGSRTRGSHSVSRRQSDSRAPPPPDQVVFQQRSAPQRQIFRSSPAMGSTPRSGAPRSPPELSGSTVSPGPRRLPPIPANPAPSGRRHRRTHSHQHTSADVPLQSQALLPKSDSLDMYTGPAVDRQTSLPAPSSGSHTRMASSPVFSGDTAPPAPRFALSRMKPAVISDRLPVHDSRPGRSLGSADEPTRSPGTSLALFPPARPTEMQVQSAPTTPSLRQAAAASSGQAQLAAAPITRGPSGVQPLLSQRPSHGTPASEARNGSRSRSGTSSDSDGTSEDTHSQLSSSTPGSQASSQHTEPDGLERLMSARVLRVSTAPLANASGQSVADQSESTDGRDDGSVEVHASRLSMSATSSVGRSPIERAASIPPIVTALTPLSGHAGDGRGGATMASYVARARPGTNDERDTDLHLAWSVDEGALGELPIDAGHWIDPLKAGAPGSRRGFELYSIGDIVAFAVACTGGNDEHSRELGMSVSSTAARAAAIAALELLPVARTSRRKSQQDAALAAGSKQQSPGTARDTIVRAASDLLGAPDSAGTNTNTVPRQSGKAQDAHGGGADQDDDVFSDAFWDSNSSDYSVHDVNGGLDNDRFLGSLDLPVVSNDFFEHGSGTKLEAAAAAGVIAALAHVPPSARPGSSVAVLMFHGGLMAGCVQVAPSSPRRTRDESGAIIQVAAWAPVSTSPFLQQATMPSQAFCRAANLWWKWMQGATSDPAADGMESSSTLGRMSALRIRLRESAQGMHTADDGSPHSALRASNRIWPGMQVAWAEMGVEQLEEPSDLRDFHVRAPEQDARDPLNSTLRGLFGRRDSLDDQRSARQSEGATASLVGSGIGVCSTDASGLRMESGLGSGSGTESKEEKSDDSGSANVAAPGSGSSLETTPQPSHGSSSAESNGSVNGPRTALGTNWHPRRVLVPTVMSYQSKHAPSPTLAKQDASAVFNAQSMVAEMNAGDSCFANSVENPNWPYVPLGLAHVSEGATGEVGGQGPATSQVLASSSSPRLARAPSLQRGHSRQDSDDKLPVVRAVPIPKCDVVHLGAEPAATPRSGDIRRASMDGDSWADSAPWAAQLPGTPVRTVARRAIAAATGSPQGRSGERAGRMGDALLFGRAADDLEIVDPLDRHESLLGSSRTSQRAGDEASASEAARQGPVAAAAAATEAADAEACVQSLMDWMVVAADQPGSNGEAPRQWHDALDVRRHRAVVLQAGGQRVVVRLWPTQASTEASVVGMLGVTRADLEAAQHTRRCEGK